MWRLTVWTVTDKTAPSALRPLHQPYLHLYLADRVVTLFGIYLALQGLQRQFLFTILVHELLVARSVRSSEWLKTMTYGTRLECDFDLCRVRALVKDGERQLLVGLVECVSVCCLSIDTAALHDGGRALPWGYRHGGERRSEVSESSRTRSGYMRA